MIKPLKNKIFLKAAKDTSKYIILPPTVKSTRIDEAIVLQAPDSDFVSEGDHVIYQDLPLQRFTPPRSSQEIMIADDGDIIAIYKDKEIYPAPGTLLLEPEASPNPSKIVMPDQVDLEKDRWLFKLGKIIRIGEVAGKKYDFKVGDVVMYNRMMCAFLAKKISNNVLVDADTVIAKKNI